MEIVFLRNKLLLTSEGYTSLMNGTYRLAVKSWYNPAIKVQSNNGYSAAYLSAWKVSFRKSKIFVLSLELLFSSRLLDFLRSFFEKWLCVRLLGTRLPLHIESLRVRVVSLWQISPPSSLFVQMEETSLISISASSIASDKLVLSSSSESIHVPSSSLLAVYPSALFAIVSSRYIWGYAIWW